MKDTPLYTHPSFDHFLRFHIDDFTIIYEEERRENAVRRHLFALDRKGFPLKKTHLDQEVYVLEEESSDGRGIKLVCAKGEKALVAMPFLIEKMVADHQNGRSRKYGPIVLGYQGDSKFFMRYYDAAVQRVFLQNARRSIYVEPATKRTSWYSEVNGHDQRRFLDTATEALVKFEGISLFLTPHLMTKKGAWVLADSTHAASLAITLLQHLHPDVSEQKVYTIALAGILQHFGALFDDEDDYYPGKLYDTPNGAAVEVLEQMGFGDAEGEQNPLAYLGVRPKDVLEVVRHRSGPLSSSPKENLVLIHCLALANHIVSAFFTAQTRIEGREGAELAHNPAFGSVPRTMARLEKAFRENFFFRFHRAKIARFIRNADRYFRMHVDARLEKSEYVSKTEREALSLRDTEDQ